MENAHFDTVMKHYNALYCNRSYVAVGARAGELVGDMHTYTYIMNLLIDASLECCGHLFFEGATARMFWFLRLLNDDILDGLVFEHLNNFATEEHIEALKGVTK